MLDWLTCSRPAATELLGAVTTFLTADLQFWPLSKETEKQNGFGRRGEERGAEEEDERGVTIMLVLHLQIYSILSNN